MFDLNWDRLQRAQKRLLHFWHVFHDLHRLVNNFKQWKHCCCVWLNWIFGTICTSVSNASTSCISTSSVSSSTTNSFSIPASIIDLRTFDKLLLLDIPHASKLFAIISSGTAYHILDIQLIKFTYPGDFMFCCLVNDFSSSAGCNILVRPGGMKWVLMPHCLNCCSTAVDLWHVAESIKIFALWIC